MHNEKNEIDNGIKSLESVARASRGYNLPINDAKPCITRLMESDIQRGMRDKSFHIIACDLINRQHKSMEIAEAILHRQNKRMSDPVRDSVITAKVKSAHNNPQMTYGCHTLQSMGLCCGQDECPFHKLLHKPQKGGKDQGVYGLMNKGWMPILKGNRFALYCAIVNLEKIKGVKAGNTLIATHWQLAKQTGASRQSIANWLIELGHEKLIHYKMGMQHSWNKTASEIQRILPIPDIPCVNSIAPPMLKDLPHIEDIMKGI